MGIRSMGEVTEKKKIRVCRDLECFYLFIPPGLAVPFRHDRYVDIERNLPVAH